jgi:uncharacterized protein (DUF4415 family)
MCSGRHGVRWDDTKRLANVAKHGIDFVDADLVAWFKAHGAGYQTRMNAVLRICYEHMRKSEG